MFDWIPVEYLMLVPALTGIFFLSAVSGGAGMLVRPLLMWLLGLPPALAVGTARLGHFGARFASIVQFHRTKRLDWRAGALFLLPSAVGGVLGTYLTASLPGDVLLRAMGVMLLVVALLSVWKPEAGIRERVAAPGTVGKVLTFCSFIVSNIVAATVGGAGVLATYALIAFHRETYISAAAIRAVAGLGGAIASSIGFIALGLVSWQHVPLVFVCAAVGNWLGVRWGIRKGNKAVRILTLVVVCAVGVRMLLF